MVNRFKSVSLLPEFDRDFKTLSRKFRSLEGDFAIFQTAQLVPFHKLGIDNGGIVRIPGLGFEAPQLYKARKFACRAQFGKGAQSGIRVIYAYDPATNHLIFVEIYYKADQANEDRKRVLKHFGKREKPA